mmetsp:Transcript_38788/g.99556  ORF Transcript_38788/g.99556 Transcript_38788/m.99556 type:complete len:162 (+) Transcript_38788:524-1009(+)
MEVATKVEAEAEDATVHLDGPALTAANVLEPILGLHVHLACAGKKGSVWMAYSALVNVCVWMDGEGPIALPVPLITSVPHARHARVALTVIAMTVWMGQGVFAMKGGQADTVMSVQATTTEVHVLLVVAASRTLLVKMGSSVMVFAIVYLNGAEQTAIFPL